LTVPFDAALREPKGDTAEVSVHEEESAIPIPSLIRGAGFRMVARQRRRTPIEGDEGQMATQAVKLDHLTIVGSVQGS
jgi:hypothetical protein